MFGFFNRNKSGPAPLWLDQPDAQKRLSRLASSIGEDYSRGLRELMETGFTVFPGVMDTALCDQTVEDYTRYLQEHEDYARQNIDVLGRHNRLVNFHMTSEAELKLGTRAFLMRFLDILFDSKACIYTSLTFEYGTEQPIHRDSPFFHTFPSNYFVGAWVALEDIDPESGPLMYIPGGHRFQIDQHAIYRRVRDAHPELNGPDLIGEALEEYYSEINENTKDMPAPVNALLRKGDLAIWHPMLPHGGSPAKDQTKTRKSVVFHCAPEALQVYQHDVFFTHESTQAPPKRYDFRDYGDRKYALAGETAFM